MNLGFPKGQAQQWATVACGFSGLLLCIALFMEHILGLAPCPLCMMQRIWVLLAGVVAWVSLVHNPRWGIYPILGLAASITGGYFSSRQLWLQSLPADQVPACGPDLAYMLDVFPMADLWVAMTSGTGDCAEVSLTILGLSIPAWTLVGFVGLAFLYVMQFRQGMRTA